MPLCLCYTTDHATSANCLVSDLQKQSKNPSVVITPTQSLKVRVQQELANNNQGFATEVTILQTWFEKMWRLFGSDRSLVTKKLRYLVMRVCIAEQADLPQTSGSISLVAKVASELLYTVVDGSTLGKKSEVIDNLSLTGDKKLCELLAYYARTLDMRHLIEPSLAFEQLLEAFEVQKADLPRVCLFGFDSFNPWQNQFIAGLSKLTEVAIYLPKLDGANSDVYARMISELERVAGTHTLNTCSYPEHTKDNKHDELARVQELLFNTTDEFIEATGQIVELNPYGPFAEPEAICDTVLKCAEAGHSEVVLCCKNTGELYDKLAQKAQAAGIEVSGDITISIPHEQSFMTLMSFFETVVDLSNRARLGIQDMSWWPPLAITDFLLSDMSFVPYDRAIALDTKWRGNRLLTPKDVLNDLQKASKTSDVVASCVSDLIAQKPIKAIHCIYDAYAKYSVEGTQSYFRTLFVLATIETELVKLHENMRTLLCKHGVPSDAERHPYDLLESFSIVRELLGNINLTFTAVQDTQNAKAHLMLIAPKDLATLPDRSIDTLIIAGLDSTTSEIPTADDSFSLIRYRLSATQLENPLAKARKLFKELLKKADRQLILERCLHNEESQELYPAVMVTELLAAYGYTGEKEQSYPFETHRYVEDAVRQNFYPEPTSITLAASEMPIAPDSVSKYMKEELKELVLVARDENGKPYLSASQIEAYLDCPYKWFTDRRLGLGDSDAGFSGVEVGSFVHYVLEMTHRRLLAESLGCELKELDKTLTLVGADTHIEGSRVSPNTLDHALEIMEEEFQKHYDYQQINGTDKRSQALVPHNNRELMRIDEIKEEIASALKWEATRFEGFEPRYFEKRFGKKDIKVDYAGAWFVGSIDRIDVDAQGHALIIDYKHKHLEDTSEYSVKFNQQKDKEFELPRHVQSLIYAQVVKRTMPELTPIGAIYFGTKDKEGHHGISGVVKPGYVDRVWNSPKKQDSNSIPDNMSFDDVLDACEDKVREAVNAMTAGIIDADSLDKNSCTYCPVSECEKRMQ